MRLELVIEIILVIVIVNYPALQWMFVWCVVCMLQPRKLNHPVFYITLYILVVSDHVNFYTVTVIG